MGGEKSFPAVDPFLSYFVDLTPVILYPSEDQCYWQCMIQVCKLADFFFPKRSLLKKKCCEFYRF